LEYGEQTADESSPYLFGDLLAMARLDWVRQMRSRVIALGYEDYRATDAIALRLLRRQSRSISELGAALGSSRQAARKLVDNLVRRGFARESRDPADARRVQVMLSGDGERYAEAVLAVLLELNAELVARVRPDLLVAADRVLRDSMRDDSLKRRAERISPPGTRRH
jgi:DNA-binding MarR family transcriptional regulator